MLVFTDILKLPTSLNALQKPTYQFIVEYLTFYYFEKKLFDAFAFLFFLYHLYYAQMPSRLINENFELPS